jgi:hypothetical protein
MGLDSWSKFWGGAYLVYVSSGRWVSLKSNFS